MLRSPRALAIAGATGLVGRRLVERAKARGFPVLELSRSRGVDLATGAGALDLTGVGAVIDATCSGSFDGEEIRRFHETVSRRLGLAAAAAAVPRTVVLSQLGAGRTHPGDESLHAFLHGKLAQEQAAVTHAPGVRIVRAAQCHETAERVILWFRDGYRVPVPDLAIQPIELEALAEFVLDVAADTCDGRAHGEILELAGPREEELAEMVSRIDETVLVEAVEHRTARTVMLPGAGATLAGRTFDDWAIRPALSGLA